jgi:hypothetical protein
VPRGLTLIDATVALSAINIAALIWHTRLINAAATSSASSAR